MSEDRGRMTVAEAGRIGGSVRSERKTASSRENGKLGGKRIRPLETIECTCGRGALLEHPTTCPRGRVIRYRRKKGLPLA